MLTYVAILFIDWTVADRGAIRCPSAFADADVSRRRTDSEGRSSRHGRLAQLHWGVAGALALAVGAWFVLRNTMVGFQVGQMGMRRVLAGLPASAWRLSPFWCCPSPRCSATAWSRSAKAGQLQPNISLAMGSPRSTAFGAAQSRWAALRRAGRGPPRWAEDLPTASVSVVTTCSRAAAAASRRETFNRCRVELRLRRPARAAAGGGAEDPILTVPMTSVPLVHAAIGELIVERSGVLNLGVEGMMLMKGGRLGVAMVSGSLVLGVFAGAVAGMLTEASSGFCSWIRRIRWRPAWRRRFSAPACPVLLVRR